MVLKRFAIVTFALFFVVERILFFLKSYSTISNDLKDDFKFFSVNCVDSEAIKALGRRYYLCEEIKEKASMSVFLQTIQFVLDSTLHQSVDYIYILHLSLILIIIYITDNFIENYSRRNENPNAIPMFEHRRIKYD